MTLKSPDALRAHAHDLAKAFNVRLIESDQLEPDEAVALKLWNGIVLCTPIVDETTYAVALHELGHLLSPLGLARSAGVQCERGNLQRLEEDAAWTWARHYALEWTPVMDAVASWAEGTYAEQPAAPTGPAYPEPYNPAPVAPDQLKKIDWTTYK